MKKQYSISLYLDTRRKKKNGLYPVKIRVYGNELEKQKFYPTIFEFSKEEFERTWKTSKPRKVYKDNKLKLQAIENKANDVASKIIPFSFDKFEKLLYRKAGESSNVFYQYDQIIERYKSLDRIKTAGNYDSSKKSLINFIRYNTGKEPQKLSFNKITPAWLEDYERYMLSIGKSLTTVAIYLRPLRAVFNTAIREDDIPTEIYPFGRGKYQLPKVRKVKKALTGEQLKRLFEAIPQTSEQGKAKDFWFLSYMFNGMNPKDIAMLRCKNIEGDKIVYYRAKTLHTGKGDLKPITVYLNDFSKSVIERYGNPLKKPEELIFPIIKDNQTATTQNNKIGNFVRSINQHIKQLAVQEDLPGDISVYWARHSFVTNAVRHGASLEFVSEALNHSSMETTLRYFSGFPDEAKKELMNKLMDFK